MKCTRPENWSQVTTSNYLMQNLRQSQLSARRPVTAKVEPVKPKPGDTVTPVAAQEKHTVRDMYMVTAANQNDVTMQKILHPLSTQPTKVMSKQYVTDHKNVRIIHTAPQIYLPKSTNTNNFENISSCQESEWNPIKHYSWDSDSEYDSEEDDGDADRVPHRETDDDAMPPLELVQHDVAVQEQEEQSNLDIVAEPDYSDSDMSDIFSVEIQRVVSQAFGEEQGGETSDIFGPSAGAGPSTGAVTRTLPPDPEVMQQFDPLADKSAMSGESDSSSDNIDA